MVGIDVDFARAFEVESLVRLDPEPHVYHLNSTGEVVAGCTTVLDRPEGVGINDYSMVPQDILGPAQERGTQVHAARHLDDDNDLDESTCSDLVLGHLEGWRRFRREHEFVPLLSEQPLVIEPGDTTCLPVAGTLDALGIRRRDRLAVVDLKTGSTLPRGVGPQLAGYAHMLRRCKVADPHERLCVQTFEDGTYKMHPMEKATDLTAWLQAVWLWHWKQGRI